MSGALKVSDLGERDLIARLAVRLVSAPSQELWAGDDAAVVVTGRRSLVTIDSLIEAVDFDLRFFTGADVGHKALAVSVSDVAAMGGRPTRAVVSLALPSDTSVAFVDDLVEGLTSAAGRWDVGLVGGDVSEASEISATVCLLGDVEGEPVLRSGARPGDALCVTGSLGGARGGLEVLRQGLDRSLGAHGRLVARQLRPEARPEAGRALRAAGATAMIDLSDGLAVDLGHVVEASDTGCAVALEALPIDPALLRARGLGLDPTVAAVLGGEDFELLAALDPAQVDEARGAVEVAGTQLTRIGTVEASERRLGARPLDEWRGQAWQHLQVP